MLMRSNALDAIIKPEPGASINSSLDNAASARPRTIIGFFLLVRSPISPENNFIICDSASETPSKIPMVKVVKPSTSVIKKGEMLKVMVVETEMNRLAILMAQTPEGRFLRVFKLSIGHFII